MKDAKNDKWEEVCTTEDLEIDVTDLKEGHRYQFRIKAVNSEGVSQPLTADGEIIAKDPWGKDFQKRCVTNRLSMKYD